MTMHRRGDLSPWAERRLTPDEQRAVRGSSIWALGGASPQGPWTAKGPGGAITDPDIRRAVNLAAGMVVL